jgi:hypothetical protein
VDTGQFKLVAGFRETIRSWLGWAGRRGRAGYGLESVRSAGRTTLYSRRQNVPNHKFPYIATALKDLPDETVINGELVALGPDGRPDFNLLQNFRSAESRIVYYAFDVLIHKQRNLTELPLSERRAILHAVIEPGEHIALSQVSDRSAAEMLQFIKDHGLEGAVAKRSDSCTSRVNEGTLEQVSDQPGAGICGRWVHSQPFGCRFPCGGVLPWQRYTRPG